jgi:hypothetical protein
MRRFQPMFARALEKIQPRTDARSNGKVAQPTSTRTAERLSDETPPTGWDFTNITVVPRGSSLQPKLATGETGDPLEHEADRVADDVMSTPPTAAKGHPVLEDVRHRPAEPVGGAFPAIVRDVVISPGQQLDSASRAFMEHRFGHDFREVRIHADAQAAESAAACGARAYTVGNHIAFGSEGYHPSESAGRRLLAHELAHVVQRRADRAAKRDATLRRKPKKPDAAKLPAGPTSGAFWQWYRKVSYETCPDRRDVWKTIGGNIGRDNYRGNTCAARVSYGLNFGGSPIPRNPGVPSADYNDPSTMMIVKDDGGKTYTGLNGDGKTYIVGAPAMNKYLRKLLGKPDGTVAKGSGATNVEAGLADYQCALFAGDEHAGLMMKGYKDAYVFDHPHVLPVDYWKLNAPIDPGS